MHHPATGRILRVADKGVNSVRLEEPSAGDLVGTACRKYLHQRIYQGQCLPYQGPDADVLEALTGSIILYDCCIWHAPV